MGNAGTVNIGAIDYLDALPEISSQYNLWFHVDAAFAVIPDYLMHHERGLAAGLEPINNYGIEL